MQETDNKRLTDEKRLIDEKIFKKLETIINHPYLHPGAKYVRLIQEMDIDPKNIDCYQSSQASPGYKECGRRYFIEDLTEIIHIFNEDPTKVAEQTQKIYQKRLMTPLLIKALTEATKITPVFNDESVQEIYLRRAEGSDLPYEISQMKELKILTNICPKFPKKILEQIYCRICEYFEVDDMKSVVESVVDITELPISEGTKDKMLWQLLDQKRDYSSKR